MSDKNEPAKCGAAPRVMGWNLAREGSRFWLINHDGERHEITLGRVEEIHAMMANMLRAAHYWKERSE